MSSGVKHSKRCDICPAVIRSKRNIREDPNYDLKGFFYGYFSSLPCVILEVYKHKRHCPCTECFLKVTCSEDCAEKIKVTRKAEGIQKEEDKDNTRYTKDISAFIERRYENRLIEQLQKSLKDTNKKYEKAQKLYSKKRK